MRNLFCFLFVFGFAVSASAQKVYFIYLETDNGSPFYVKMGDDIHSSSSTGYLILSNLVDSTYKVSIGFPPSGSESRFQLKLGARDKGYLIRNLDSGIGLFDLQQLNITRPLIDESQKTGTYRRRDDDFTMLLAKASKDTSLLWVPVQTKNDVAIAEPPQPEPIRPVPEEIRKSLPLDSTLKSPVIINEDRNPKDSIGIAEKNLLQDTLLTAIIEDKIEIDSSLAENGDNISLNKEDQRRRDSLVNYTPVKKEPEQKENVLVEFKRSVVKKYAESSTSEGFGLVYFDQNENGTDTIRLLIPNPPVILRRDDTIQKDEKLFLDITNENQEKIVKKEDNKIHIPKPDCPETATKSDFLKLRRNMAAEITDEAMVDEAKKYFRNKCFTTEQVKNLGALFLTSAGKYLFFDAAYMHVTDQEKFAGLGSEITDEYYQKRFKALIGE